MIEKVLDQKQDQKKRTTDKPVLLEFGVEVQHVGYVVGKREGSMVRRG